MSDRGFLLEGQRLDRYIQNLLDMTRLGHGTLKLHREWIGLDEIVGSALTRLRKLAPGATFETRLASGLPLLYVHPALVGAWRVTDSCTWRLLPATSLTVSTNALVPRLMGTSVS